MSATVAKQLSVVPTVITPGDAFNVVRAASELMLGLRPRSLAVFEPVLAAVEPEIDGSRCRRRRRAASTRSACAQEQRRR